MNEFNDFTECQILWNILLSNFSSHNNFFVKSIFWNLHDLYNYYIYNISLIYNNSVFRTVNKSINQNSSFTRKCVLYNCE